MKEGGSNSTAGIVEAGETNVGGKIADRTREGKKNA